MPISPTYDPSHYHKQGSENRVMMVQPNNM